MKRNNFIISLLICLGLTCMFSSCGGKEEKKEAYVTFGANSHVINCISNVTIFLDDENIGVLETHIDTINDCGELGTLTKQISVGEHTYRAEIRPVDKIAGNDCTKNVTGKFTVSENECKKVFIDYFKIFRQSNCDQDVIIDDEEFYTAPDYPLHIDDIEIVDNCLKIKFSAGGCDGTTWVVKLIDNGVVAKSDPCQRALRLSLDNKEICCSFATKEVSFNIEDLQIKGSHRVWLTIYTSKILNIAGHSILYEY